MKTVVCKKRKKLYQRILRADPEHADALHYLGLIAHQLGRSETAVGLITRAIEKEPERAVYFVNLGQVWEASGALDKAIANYRKATLLDPGLEAAFHKLGDGLLKQGQLAEAAASYGRALTIQPDTPQTINSLGSVLYEAGRLEQSIVCYQKAIALKAGYAEAYNNLGIAFNCLGRFDEAIASWNRALYYEPALAAAHCNLGGALVARGEVQQAVESLCRAIELEPALVEAHLNLGNAYRAQGSLTQATVAYERSAALSANPASAYNNLAETFRDQGQLEKAVESYENALSARPDFAAAHSNLLYLYAFTRCISPEAERTQAERWEKSVLSDDERAAARKRALPDAGVFRVRPRPGRQLRLGIVSAELGSHAVAQFLQPLVRELDRRRFHVTLFPTSRRSCARAQEFKELSDSYISITELSDGAAAEQIRSEQIDVLMDTTAHTFGGRLGIFAHRAAPVQCSYIGYWSTTGLTEMDWFFADPHFARSVEAHFTEGLWWLPRLFHCYQGEDALRESAWVPDPQGTIWLGSLNRFNKMREEALGLWAKVLHGLPEAKLVLEDGALHEEETHRRILTTLSRHGIAEDRVDFIPFVAGHERHMALYDRLDIALDTIPFNGGTTTFDALWMGVPMVALEGNWVGEMLGSSVLKAFDRPEWVARDQDEYGCEPWRVTLVDTGVETMTGGRLRRILPHVRDEEMFCFTYGDGLADIDLADLIAFHRRHKRLVNLTAVQPMGRFGALGIGEDGSLLSFAEKPKGDGRWVNGGFFVLSPKVGAYLKDDTTVWEQEPMDAIMRSGGFAAYKHFAYWQPMDTVHDKSVLEALWNSGSAPWKVWE
jgi:predicted O-linked N-acetylglucosamine transferase (SPINDLY family)